MLASSLPHRANPLAIAGTLALLSLVSGCSAPPQHTSSLQCVDTRKGAQCGTVDQQNEYGRSVVLELQAQYQDTARACPDGSPAFNCNGVVIRAIRNPADPKFWNPSESGIAREGVSFSYIRADVGNTKLAGHVGLIMRPLGQPALQPLTVTCAFAYNAATGDRVKSCGTTQFPLPCHESGVVDIPTWVEHYKVYGAFESCYFAPTTEQFQLSIDVREHFPNPIHRDVWNEIVLRNWPLDIPERLPLQALFFSDSPFSDNGLEEARMMQDSFIQATGLFIPVIRVEMKKDPVFFYAPKDQVTVVPRSRKAASQP